LWIHASGLRDEGRRRPRGAEGEKVSQGGTAVDRYLHGFRMSLRQGVLGASHRLVTESGVRVTAGVRLSDNLENSFHFPH
jgi:hypothetical protein